MSNRDRSALAEAEKLIEEHHLFCACRVCIAFVNAGNAAKGLYNAALVLEQMWEEEDAVARQRMN